ncbi:MAG: ABC transporter substrate-binding protein, partial [Pseudoclavibacter sp.]
VSISQPDMMPALRSGSVDAAVVAEPFLTMMLGSGATDVIRISSSGFPVRTPIGLTAANTTFSAENPEVIAAINAALEDALAWIHEDEQRFRDALPEYVNVTPEQAASMRMPTFDTTLTEEGMTSLVEAMQKFGFLTTEVDVASLMPAA